MKIQLDVADRSQSHQTQDGSSNTPLPGPSDALASRAAFNENWLDGTQRSKYRHKPLGAGTQAVQPQRRHGKGPVGSGRTMASAVLHVPLQHLGKVHAAVETPRRPTSVPTSPEAITSAQLENWHIQPSRHALRTPSVAGSELGQIPFSVVTALIICVCLGLAMAAWLYQTIVRPTAISLSELIVRSLVVFRRQGADHTKTNERRQNDVESLSEDKMGGGWSSGVKDCGSSPTGKKAEMHMCVNGVLGRFADGIVRWTADEGGEEGLLLPVREWERKRSCEL